MKSCFIFLALSLCALLFAGCYKDATVSVTNNVHNVQLDNINFDQFGIGSRILPGESTPELTISESEGVRFPLSAPLQFYMIKGDRRVFLTTKEHYTLNADDRLVIVISDDTEVVTTDQ
jgi:hypothetical protein